MLLQDDFQRWVATDPSRVALVIGSATYSYGDLDGRANALAARLRAAGIIRGDRVALFLENGLHFVVGVLAVLRLGAVFMPVNPSTKRDKLLYILHDSRASALLTQKTLSPVWSSVMSEAQSLRVLIADGYASGDPEAIEWPDATADQIATQDLIDADLAAIIYTSGSTGDAKGVMLTHLNMVTAATSVSTYLGLRGEDRILCALPLSFDYGLYQVLMAFRVGARVVIERNFSFPVRALEVMARERVTVFPGVPTMFAMLINLSNVRDYDLTDLRMITNTAAALSETHIARIRALFPRATLFSMYGLTECKRVTYLPPEQLDVRPTSVGRGMPNEEVWLVDEAGQRLPFGSTGELVIRGSHVMRGYWEKPKETAERLRPGPIPGEMVLYSGDLFRTDSEGWLYFVARRDDIIKSRGEKVSPREVENAITALEGVREVAVIGVADEILGQSIKAFVVRTAGSQITARDVMKFSATRLESYMVPTAVEFVDELPQTVTGKIKKTDLH